MKTRQILRGLVLYALISSLASLGICAANFLFMPLRSFVSPTDALFLEGAGSLTVGVLLLLGRGGMNSASVDAALLSARAEAVCGTETVGPGEQLRRDSWKSKGFIRAGLFLLTTGFFLILGYVLTL